MIKDLQDSGESRCTLDLSANITEVLMVEEAQRTNLEELRGREESHKCWMRDMGERERKGKDSADRAPCGGRACSQLSYGASAQCVVIAHFSSCLGSELIPVVHLCTCRSFQPRAEAYTQIK